MEGDSDDDDSTNIKSAKFDPVVALYSNILSSDDEESEDEILNVQSEKFDPFQALYAKKLVVPFPKAPTLDNVAKANYLLSNNQNLVKVPHKAVKLKEKLELSTSKSTKINPEDESNQETMSEKYNYRNVLTRMNDIVGPLAFLRNCMEKRIRVKVWTRHATGIRGYCIAFIAAFDKHWNLALEDVHEVWTRKVKRKKVLLGEAAFTMPLAWKAMGPMVKPPKVVVTKKEKGLETCERHVNQMLMRGEHVAFISVLEKL